jgi:hypothetical protein
VEHAGDGPAWVLALEHSGLGQALRQSLWLYPLANVVHVLAMAVLVGSILAFDLRMLGLARSLPADRLARLLLPLAGTGLAAALLTGSLLFTADAGAVWANPVFPVKLTLIALGLVNIALVHAGPFRSLAGWGSGGLSPRPARIGAALSILIWFSVAGCGRLIAYF